MMKITCYKRKERNMENVLSVIKFVLACVLATLETVLSFLYYVNAFFSAVLIRIVLRLSPDVGKMTANTEDSMMSLYIKLVRKL